MFVLSLPSYHKALKTKILQFLFFYLFNCILNCFFSISIFMKKEMKLKKFSIGHVTLLKRSLFCHQSLVRSRCQFHQHLFDSDLGMNTLSNFWLQVILLFCDVIYGRLIKWKVPIQVSNIVLIFLLSHPRKNIVKNYRTILSIVTPTHIRVAIWPF